MRQEPAARNKWGLGVPEILRGPTRRRKLSRNHLLRSRYCNETVRSPEAKAEISVTKTFNTTTAASSSEADTREREREREGDCCNRRDTIFGCLIVLPTFRQTVRFVFSKEDSKFYSVYFHPFAQRNGE